MSDKINAIRALRKEADRFFAALQTFEGTVHYQTLAGRNKSGEPYAYSSREMGSLKRASLDLSQALVNFRKAR